MKQLLIFAWLLLAALGASAQAPADSVGIYAVTGAAVTRVPALNYKGTKVSRGFMSAKAKLEFAGATSQTQFTGAARFRIYFGTPAPSDVAALYMFMPNYSIGDFAVGRFDVKKQSRFLTTSTASILGASGGAKEADGVALDVVELRPGVYDVTVTGVPGEYCIFHNFRGSGGYGGVFDFTLK